MEKILVVDDSKINVMVAKMALEEKGYQVLTADNGQTAIDLTLTEKPDLILLDVLMPVLNGFETCKILKKNPKTKNIPVIFLTALEELPAKKEGFEIGADDYITKPYIIDELLLRVDLILRIKREKDSIRSHLAEVAASSKLLSKEQTKIIQREKELVIKQIYVSLHHEIRNPLTTILIGSQLLESLHLEGSGGKIVNEILTCAKRIRDIMDALGSMKEFVVEDYIEGTKMIDLKKTVTKNNHDQN